MFFQVYSQMQNISHQYMKKSITTLHDALCYMLQGLVFTEEKIKKEFSSCRKNITDSGLKSELDKYVESADNKLLKLQRAFGYLTQDTVSRKNEVITKMLDETHRLLSPSTSSQLKDILMLSCLQNISSYKISAYKTAFLFALELELDTVADLIQQILEWETETGKHLSPLALEMFNKIQKIDTVR